MRPLQGVWPGLAGCVATSELVDRGGVGVIRANWGLHFGGEAGVVVLVAVLRGPPAPGSRPPGRSARTRCGSRSSPAPARPASPSRTSRTPPGTPAPHPTPPRPPRPPHPPQHTTPPPPPPPPPPPHRPPRTPAPGAAGQHSTQRPLV